MESSKRGAPTKWRPEYAEQARKYCLLDGATDEELATSFDVSVKTIDNWKNKYPDFLQAVQEGKKIADANVAEAFYKRAVGIEYTEVTRELVGSDLTVTKEVTKLIPPDAGAALNWLKNRQREKWRDKVEVAHSGKIDSNNLSNLSDAQLTQLLVELEAKASRDSNQP